MNNKFLFTADNHLKRKIWASRPDIEYDTFHSFSQVVDYAIANNIGAIVLGGDNCDNTYPSPEVIQFLIDEVTRGKKNGVSFFGIDGNHDGHKFASWLNVCGIVYLPDHPQEKFLGSKFNLIGIPHSSQDEIEETIDEYNVTIPGTRNILVMHQLLDLTCPLEGMYNLKANQIPPEVPLVLMGDYHVTTQVTNGTTTFMYPGSTAMMSISEPDHKFFIELTLGDSVQAKMVPLETRKFFNIEIRNAGEADELLQELAQQIAMNTKDFAKPSDKLYRQYIAMPFVVADYEPTIEGIVQRIRTVTSNKATLLLRPIVTEQKDSKKILTSANFSELLGSFIDSKEHKQAFDFASVLGNSREGVDVASLVNELYESIGLVNEAKATKT